MKASNKSDRMKMLMYLIEAKRLGIRVKLPHVNASDINLTIQSDDEGDYIRFGLSNIKGIGAVGARKLIENGPWESYQQLLDKSGEKYSGISAGVIKSLNAVGAAAFEDNPRTGNESNNFYVYLNIPTLNYDLTDDIKVQFRSLVDFNEAETFPVLAIAQNITRKNGWQRVDFVDETGSAGIFTDPEAPFTTGLVYVLMVSNNTVVDYVVADDLAGSKIERYLKAESFPDVVSPMHKVVTFHTRTTKAGNRMADVVLSDEYKNLTGAIVFPKMFAQAHTYLKPGRVVDVDLNELDDGKYCINNIL
jgi:DNA polymerase-3 subunit alpha